MSHTSELLAFGYINLFSCLILYGLPPILSYYEQLHLNILNWVYVEKDIIILLLFVEPIIFWKYYKSSSLRVPIYKLSQVDNFEDIVFPV